MAKIGSFMVLAGVVSALLSFVGYELRLLMWVDMWGTGIGWAIRGALVVGGGALFALGGGLGGDEATSEATE